MKNREKFEKEIIDIASDCIAVTKEGKRVVMCECISCSECLFEPPNCREKIKEWAESEYAGESVISKRDRLFLDYLREEYKFIARDKNGGLFMFKDKPRKEENYCCWVASSNCLNLYMHFLNVDFPMVKWEDKEPWKIEDLKKLKVIEKYD